MENALETALEAGQRVEKSTCNEEEEKKNNTADV